MLDVDTVECLAFSFDLLSGLSTKLSAMIKHFNKQWWMALFPFLPLYKAEAKMSRILVLLSSGIVFLPVYTPTKLRVC